jgi:hypothetical protein
MALTPTAIGAAPLASPTFTGTVTSPAFSGPLTGNVTGNVSGSAASATTSTTQAAGDNSTNIATTAFVSTLVGGTTTATASKATNGYQKLSSGVILQWGSSSITAGGPTAISFPIAFPTAVGSIQMTISGGTTPTAYNSLLQGSVTTSGFNALGGPGMSVSFTWFAIGY